MVLPLIFSLLLQAPRFTGPSCTAGEGWSFAIRGKDVDKSPRWRKSHDVPPLPARAAERSARAFLRRMGCHDSAAWDLHQIALQPIAGEKDVWVYLIEFTEPLRPQKAAGVGSFFPRVVNVPVLLDGTVIAPSVGPWPSPR